MIDIALAANQLQESQGQRYIHYDARVIYKKIAAKRIGKIF
jgi:hypothetical protein